MSRVGNIIGSNVFKNYQGLPAAKFFHSDDAWWDEFDGFQNPDFFLAVSGAVKSCAVTLSKISKDLRLMSSGPRAGWMEINLPALSPGSSIMPGKINPTVPEMVIQIAHQVCGNDVAITMAVDEGELGLNVWDATFYKCLFENMQILGAEIPILREHCVEGITTNVARCKTEAQESISLVPWLPLPSVIRKACASRTIVQKRDAMSNKP